MPPLVADEIRLWRSATICRAYRGLPVGRDWSTQYPLLLPCLRTNRRHM